MARLLGWLTGAVLAAAPVGAQHPETRGTLRGSRGRRATGAPLEQGPGASIEEARANRSVTDADGAVRAPGSAARRPTACRSRWSGYSLFRRDVTVAAARPSTLTIPLSEGTGAYSETVTVAAERFREHGDPVPSQQILGSAELQNLRGVLTDDPAARRPGAAGRRHRRRPPQRVHGPRQRLHAHELHVDGFATPYLLHTVRGVEDRGQARSR